MTIREMHLLAAETGVSLPSIRKWCAGGELQRAIIYALEQGCKRLKITPPPTPAESGPGNGEPSEGAA